LHGESDHPFDSQVENAAPVKSQLFLPEAFSLHLRLLEGCTGEGPGKNKSEEKTIGRVLAFFLGSPGGGMKRLSIFILFVLSCIFTVASFGEATDTHAEKSAHGTATPEETFKKMETAWQKGIEWNQGKLAADPKALVKPKQFIGDPDALGSRCGRKKADGTYEIFPAIFHFSQPQTAASAPISPVVYLSEFPASKGYRYFSDRNQKLINEVLPRNSYATVSKSNLESQRGLVKTYKELLASRTLGDKPMTSNQIALYSRLQKSAEKNLADMEAGMRLSQDVYYEERQDHDKYFDDKGNPKPGVLAASYNQSLDHEDKHASVYSSQKLDKAGKPESKTVIRNMVVKIDYGGTVGVKNELMQSLPYTDVSTSQTVQTYCL
jgi:hypothetical protein